MKVYQIKIKKLSNLFNKNYNFKLIEKKKIMII